MATNKEQETLWGGRFEQRPSQALQKLSVSVQVDKRLYREDIQGSKAHCRMLHSIGILSKDEITQIMDALDQIKQEIEQGVFHFREDLEDIHTNIEHRVTQICGPLGGKMHTGRSRNDQVITDTMLWLRTALGHIKKELVFLLHSLLERAGEHKDTIMPGYTHLQVAQPIRLGHHFLAYFETFKRDLRRLLFCNESLSECPLGSGAMSGANYPLDRKMTAELLGFAGVSANSMDSVSQRDWLLDFHHFAATLFIHLSRFSEEMILWSSQEFSFVRLSDSVTTGSSIMPQKRNPDIAELIRGKSGRVIGNQLALLVTLKSLPLTYNRDLQEDKEGLFDSVDTILLSLPAFREMIAKAQFLPPKMKDSLKKGYSLATDLADYLAEKGMPFRQAHELVGRIVLDLEKQGKFVEDLNLEALQEYSPLFTIDVLGRMDYRISVESKKTAGSTSFSSVQNQIAQAEKFLRNTLA